MVVQHHFQNILLSDSATLSDHTHGNWGYHHEQELYSRQQKTHRSHQAQPVLLVLANFTEICLLVI